MVVRLDLLKDMTKQTVEIPRSSHHQKALDCRSVQCGIRHSWRSCWTMVAFVQLIWQKTQDAAIFTYYAALLITVRRNDLGCSPWAEKGKAKWSPLLACDSTSTHQIIPENRVHIAWLSADADRSSMPSLGTTASRAWLWCANELKSTNGGPCQCSLQVLLLRILPDQLFDIIYCMTLLWCWSFFLGGTLVTLLQSLQGCQSFKFISFNLSSTAVPKSWPTSNNFAYFVLKVLKIVF